MKNFSDFVQSLDVDFCANLEKTLNTTPEVVNAPSTGARIHCETAIIATTLIGKYHEWLIEQLD
jgi:hypothetical protein